MAVVAASTTNKGFLVKLYLPANVDPTPSVETSRAISVKSSRRSGTCEHHLLGPGYATLPTEPSPLIPFRGAPRRPPLGSGSGRVRQPAGGPGSSLERKSPDQTARRPSGRQFERPVPDGPPRISPIGGRWLAS